MPEKHFETSRSWGLRSEVRCGDFIFVFSFFHKIEAFHNNTCYLPIVCFSKKALAAEMLLPLPWFVFFIKTWNIINNIFIFNCSPLARVFVAFLTQLIENHQECVYKWKIAVCRTYLPHRGWGANIVSVNPISTSLKLHILTFSPLFEKQHTNHWSEPKQQHKLDFKTRPFFLQNHQDDQKQNMR